MPHRVVLGLAGVEAEHVEDAAAVQQQAVAHHKDLGRVQSPGREKKEK